MDKYVVAGGPRYGAVIAGLAWTFPEHLPLYLLKKKNRERERRKDRRKGEGDSQMPQANAVDH